MKRGYFLLWFLLLGVPAACHAFTLDIASHEVAEYGHGPRSIFVPGYGEVVFQSGLDGALVVDSAYASTERIDLPPGSGSALMETAKTGAETDPGFVEITHRWTDEIPPSPHAPLHPVDADLQNPPENWNAVPEAASATLGLVGTLMLLLRRRHKTMPAGAGKS